ncbi:hypothetical protein TPV1_gp11 [Thermococcus prieurii virus 1]|uniref:hypothetical protein n=1 Tax=Thermococcus prieurii virus 1 TaxID=1115696 RepID=UPI00024FB211|nr:hypothetical protein TPV1_gp11 [Thermococcus prieurii virus 1]AEY69060.1 hypothetical protein [Thermococcus prieurii virus 1]AFA44823.1 hypothetical protein [Thermococcus prieurii virus 1]
MLSKVVICFKELPGCYELPAGLCGLQLNDVLQFLVKLEANGVMLIKKSEELPQAFSKVPLLALFKVGIAQVLGGLYLVGTEKAVERA